MDFNYIEGLNTEDILELYKEIIEKNGQVFISGSYDYCGGGYSCYWSGSCSGSGSCSVSTSTCCSSRCLSYYCNS